MIYLKEKSEHENLYKELLDENANEENIKNIKGCCNEATALEKERLMCKVTLDKRLNTKDLKLYSYILNFNHLNSTQEEIADLLDMSRSNVNKSLEKLTAFNYIDKKSGNSRAGKRAEYKIIKFDEAGICICEASSIIRMVNVIATKKYKYYSLEDINKMEIFMVHARKDIEILRTIINDSDIQKVNSVIDKVKTIGVSTLETIFDDDLKNKGYITRKTIEFYVDSIKEDILEVKNNLKDFYSMRNSIEVFKKEFYDTVKSTNVTKEETKEVLDNDNMLCILFLDRSEDENIIKFKEKYLGDYVKFLNKFTSISENTNFFKLLYENKEEFRFTIMELMRLCDVKHRETPSYKAGFDKRVKDTLDNFEDEIHNLLADEEYVKNKDVKMLLFEIKDLQKQYDFLRNSTVKCGDEQKEIDVEELERAQKNIPKLIYVLNLAGSFKDSYKISIEDYANLLDRSLEEFIKKVNEVRKLKK